MSAARTTLMNVDKVENIVNVDIVDIVDKLIGIIS